MPQKDEVELRWLFAVIRRWWWLILGCGLLAAVTAFVVASQMPPVYSASATLLVEAAESTNQSAYSDILASQQLANTYSQMVAGRPILETAIARLGLGESPGKLAERVEIGLVPDTQLIQLSVEDPDPIQAAVLANTIAEVFTVRAGTLEVEQYTELLTSLREQMDALSALMENTQEQIDNLKVTTILDQTELARKESLLSEYSSEHQTLKQRSEDLQLTASLQRGNVQVIDAARVPGNLNQSPFTSTVTLLVDQPSVTAEAAYNAILVSERLASTYSQMLTRRPVLEEAIAQLELGDSPDALAERVNAVSVAGTPLIWLTVVYADPGQAVLLANTIAEIFIAQMQTLQQERYLTTLASIQEQVDELSTQIEDTQTQIDGLSAKQIQEQAELARKEDLLEEHRSDYRMLQRDYEELRLTMVQSSDNVSIIEAAEVPKSPVGPARLLYTLLAAVVGVVVGAVVAFLLEQLDVRIRTPEEVNDILGLNTLASIGRLGKGEEELVVVAEPRSPVAESFRVLTTNIRFASVDRPLQTLLVTSPQPSEGKTTIVANLATATARAGLSAVAVDADLRRPRLHRLFGLDARAGLSESIVDGNIDGRLQSTGVEGLMMLSSGGLPPNPAELLGSPRMQELLRKLAGQADMVLLDSPPILPAADAAVLARAVDGVLLVLDAEHSRREAAQQALERLRQVKAPIIGVVLNGLPSHEQNYYMSGRTRPTKPQPGWKRALAAGSRMLKRNERGPSDISLAEE